MQRRQINSRIALSTENLQQLVSLLNEFSLPRAVLDFEKDSFVAWNSRFCDHTGFTENEMKSSKLEDLLILGESPIPLFEQRVEQRAGQAIEYTTCAAKRPFGADPAPGYVVRSGGKSDSGCTNSGEDLVHREVRTRLEQDPGVR